FPIVHVLCALGFEIDLTGTAQYLQKIFDAITVRRGSELVEEGLDSEGVVDIGYRAQPADAHMRLRRSVLGAQVRDVERQVHPSLGHLPIASVTRCSIKSRPDRRKHAALQPRDEPPLRI